MRRLPRIAVFARGCPNTPQPAEARGCTRTVDRPGLCVHPVMAGAQREGPAGRPEASTGGVPGCRNKGRLKELGSWYSPAGRAII
ncbi:MAG TPA: hypothetical protein DEA73_08855 [Peptococcaceae bacterium]|nr:hypothetical protein [Peptococcaceae bacterium]